MSADIELKLALSPKQLARLRAHALLRNHARPGGRRSKQVKTYYDTPRRLLRDSALSLGLEKSGAQAVQTLAAPNAATPLAVSTVDGDAPDIKRFPDRRWRKLLNRNGQPSKLAPVFTTEVEHSRLPLRVHDSMIDIAFDVGKIKANGRQVPICEARLELIAGKPEQLYQLALDLHEAVPFHLEHRNTIGRGYSLLAEDKPAAAKAQETPIAPDATVGEAFLVLARAGFAHLCANEAGVLHDGNPDAVHQMRVAVRRLRALFAAFQPVLDPDESRFLRGELGWLQRQLGPARDWDVFLKDTLDRLSRDLPKETSLGELRGAVAAARDKAYVLARGTLRDRRYTRLLLRFQLWLDSARWNDRSAGLGDPILPFAARILHKRDAKLDKLASRMEHLREAELHEVRLRAKKLRYAAEFFRPLYPLKPARKFIRSLITIQDTLGSLHDAMVGRDLMVIMETNGATTEKSAKPRKTRAIKRASAIVAGFQTARIADDTQRFREVWPRFAALKKFWRAS